MNIPKPSTAGDATCYKKNKWMYIVVFCMSICCILNVNIFKQHSNVNISGKTGWYDRKNNYHRKQIMEYYFDLLSEQ